MTVDDDDDDIAMFLMLSSCNMNTLVIIIFFEGSETVQDIFPLFSFVLQTFITLPNKNTGLRQIINKRIQKLRLITSNSNHRTNFCNPPQRKQTIHQYSCEPKLH